MPSVDSEVGGRQDILLKCSNIQTLNDIRYLQTPDWSVDFISSSRWSRMISYNDIILYIHIILQWFSYVDKFVPGQNLCHLSYSSFTDFNPDKDLLISIKILWKYKNDKIMHK